MVDDLIPRSPNLVAGSNREGFHLLDTNCGRDYTAGVVADIVSASEGHACDRCGGALRLSRGVEVGNIFKLGTRYSDSFGCSFLDRDGERKPVIMGSYGIGSGRLLACVAEEHNDEKGLRWPITVAPFPVHIVVLRNGETAAANLHDDLAGIGLEPLLDDREEVSAGVKFNDADLIGIPLRLTVGGRSLAEDKIELRLRATGETTAIPLGQIVADVRREADALAGQVAARVVTVPYVD